MNSLSDNIIIETVRGDKFGYAKIFRIWDLRNYPIRISWLTDNVENKIEDEGRIFFFECADDLLFVLFQGNASSQILHPNNLLVYNSFGKIIKTISAPKFKTKEMGKILKTNKSIQGYMKSISKKENKLEVVISNNYWFEIQYLDSTTMEFSPKAKFGGRH